jgi:FtsH-binding integral membrane protein
MSFLSSTSFLRRRCLSSVTAKSFDWVCSRNAKSLDLACSRRHFSSRFQSKKRKVEVLEKEPEAPFQQATRPFEQQGAAPSSAFPQYVARDEREQADSQYSALGDGAVAHMRKVYGTLATGIGIAAGASMFSMATPLVAMHPLIPGLAAMVPLMGIMYTSKHTHSQALRVGLFAAFTGLSGVATAPLLFFAMKVSPMLVPQALLITTGLFGAMTALSLMAKPGQMLRWGVPLGGGMIMLMMVGLGGMFVPPTSAWYPLLHNVMLYGGLVLFTMYIAYDTQKMID